MEREQKKFIALDFWMQMQHEVGRMTEEISHRVRERDNLGGALTALWRNKRMSDMCEISCCIVLHTGVELW